MEQNVFGVKVGTAVGNIDGIVGTIVGSKDGSMLRGKPITTLLQIATVLRCFSTPPPRFNSYYYIYLYLLVISYYISYYI